MNGIVWRNEAARERLEAWYARFLKRVRTLVPDVDAESISGCKHCPPTTDEFRSWLAGRVAAFLS